MPRLRTRDPLELARIRVARFVDWAELHAPYGWQRHLLDIHNHEGKVTVSFRATPRYISGHDSILGLIFENDDAFVLPPGGYVTDDLVMREYKLTERHCIIFGLYAPFGNRAWTTDVLREEMVHQVALEKAWLEALTSYARPPHTPHFRLPTLGYRVDQKMKLYGLKTGITSKSDRSGLFARVRAFRKRLVSKGPEPELSH
jgi:hypothetical protein